MSDDRGYLLNPETGEKLTFPLSYKEIIEKAVEAFCDVLADEIDKAEFRPVPRYENLCEVEKEPRRIAMRAAIRAYEKAKGE